MTERIIIAGAGGQGIMLLGKILALSALKENKQVSWIPSYGAEVRGGTAFCTVVISDEEIPSPFVEKADTLILMNGPSFERFKDRIDKNGLMIINSSLVKSASRNPARKKILVPFTDIAYRLKNIRVANVVALGAYIAKKRTFSLKTASKVIEEMAPDDKRALIEINQKALFAGCQAIKRA